MSETVEMIRPGYIPSVAVTFTPKDGGVNQKNAGDIFAAGADILVAGSAVFHSDDPAAAIAAMKHSVA